MKPGDLICYNAGGMKTKTLGLVIDVEVERQGWNKPPLRMVLIQWCIVGKYMPRRQWRDISWNPRERIKPGEFVWHEIGDWLEVMK